MFTSSNPALIPSIVNRSSFEHKNVCTIEVTLDSKSLGMGKTYNENILVETGNPKHSQLTIPIHITTTPQIRIAPSMIAWGMPKIGEELTRSLSLTSPYGEHLLVSECVAPDDFETQIKDIGEEIEITIVKQFNKFGINKSHLKVVFANPPKTEISVPMYVYVQE
jgi:hypothetical protein